MIGVTAQLSARAQNGNTALLGSVSTCSGGVDGQPAPDKPGKFANLLPVDEQYGEQCREDTVAVLAHACMRATWVVACAGVAHMGETGSGYADSKSADDCQIGNAGNCSRDVERHVSRRFCRVRKENFARLQEDVMGETMRLSYDVSSADQAQGVVAYSEYVVSCPITGRPTHNVYRNRINGRLVEAFDQEAADKIGVREAA